MNHVRNHRTALWLAAALLLAATLGLGACDGLVPTPSPSPSVSPSSTPTPTPAASPSPSPTASGDVDPANITVKTVPSDLGEAVAFAQNLVVGWNLGNTLDAGGWNGFSPTSLAEYETSWGNPVTTQAMIDAVKAAGFRSIRIPTTWGQKMGAAPDYTVDSAWMNRVQQVVDYAYGIGLYVILNVHHDNSWIIPTYTNQAATSARLAKLWTQIATRFAAYDEHLIFEGLNEPRVEGSSSEWSGGTAEYRAVINIYNQLFVDTVRATGGNNATRYLMVPPHAASGSSTALSGFELPTDTANPARLIVSLHSYSPYNFALNTGTGGTASWGTAAEKSALSSELQGYYDRFVSQGIPVVIGEFGAIDRSNTATRKAWGTWYTAEARARYMVCVVWDNNAFDAGEKFGLLRRSTVTWAFPEVVQGFMNGLAD